MPHLMAGAARHAAVALILRESPELEVMLIRRTERPSDPWSGHIAFPGGRREERDAHLLETAVRETREEIALDLERQAAFAGRLDDQVAYARGARLDMAISPFVFTLSGSPELVLSDEVAEVIWAPLGPMVSGEVDTSLQHEINGVAVTLPGFRIGAHTVWGLTHRMLANLFDLGVR